jgi:flagellar export protein FliJ
MTPFRFRGEAALVLRRRQEDQAALALAHAEAELHSAREAVAAARQAVEGAQDRLAAASTSGISMSALAWHRNWVVRQQSLAEERIGDEERREAEVATARQRWQESRRRRLVIERWRDRALGRHQVEAHRQERNLIDELARLRFTYAARD